MKKLIAIALFLALATVEVSAGAIYFDTEVRYTNVISRFTRIAADVAPEIKARLAYNVINGYLITGDLNNFSLTGQSVYTIKLMDGFTAEPFAGAGFASSDNGTAVFGDIGVDLKYKMFLWLVAGADVQIYSDSYIMDYKGGIQIPFLSWLSLDLLYSAVLTNDKHLTGFGGRINLLF